MVQVRPKHGFLLKFVEIADISYPASRTFQSVKIHLMHISDMDTAIDLSDASKALDLANIRFQLMYVKTHLQVFLEGADMP